jgi:hypothetical protein
MKELPRQKCQRPSTRSSWQVLALVFVVLLAVPGLSSAQETPSPEYSPYPDQTFPNSVYFGDTHLHTSYSADAGMIGCIKSPEDAFRVSRGEEITSSTGLRVKMARPLDFAVVSDHSENLGLAPALDEGDEELLSTRWGKVIYAKYKAGLSAAAYDQWRIAKNSGTDPLAETELQQKYWGRAIDAAEEYNEPGKFTAFIGFEWTSGPEGGKNLHRNVVFRDDKLKASQVVPISAYDSVDPEDLWQWLADYEEKTGGKVLAIAHNGNLSNGLMFDDVTLTSKEPLTKDYAQRRMRWEPIYEVTQMKGDGEAHPVLSPNDEFADFYTWDTATLGPAVTSPDMWPREYAREALKRGLDYEEKLGANPFKFGMIGSTDSHTGIPSSEENNYFGKVVEVEPSAEPERFDEVIAGRVNGDDNNNIYHWEAAAAGLAAVWSRENTREALWDAMARKETYATTGTRLQVRLFAGWDFTTGDLYRSNFAEHGYENGVPMGGDLTMAPADKAPIFLVQAARDPIGANLDRVQIVKGWLDADGETHEEVYDVAVSDDRQPLPSGKYPPVGNTVNASEPSYSNSIGDPTLSAYWKDPDFDAGERAFYYVRVIEIPTPRWYLFDVKIFGVDLPEPDAPTSLQERAYTSPVWYTPGSSS